MNAEMRFKDKRILEALEYIDEKYIDDVFDFLKEPDMMANENVKRSPFRYWKHYLGFVACILVLALATPMFTRLPEIINSFAAGWGEGTEESTNRLNETTGSLETVLPETNNVIIETEKSTDKTTEVKEVLDVYPVYWHFIPELEEISIEEMISVQNAWEIYSCEELRDWYYNIYTKNYGGKDGYTEEKILEMVNNSVEEFYQSRFVKDKNNYV